MSEQQPLLPEYHPQGNDNDNNVGRFAFSQEKLAKVLEHRRLHQFVILLVCPFRLLVSRILTWIATRL